MNRDELGRLIARVGAIAPYLTGGTLDIHRDRLAMLSDSFGDTSLVEALVGLDQLLREGQNLSWSAIVGAAQSQRRLTMKKQDQEITVRLHRQGHCGQRTCHIPAAEHGRPRPADFNELVAQARDRVRADAAEDRS